MVIRTAVAADVDSIMSTHLSAVTQICSAVYQPDEISAWIAGGTNPGRYLSGIMEGRFIVALLGETVVGFSDFDLGTREVCGMFVAPSHVRQGIGRALLLEVEARAVRQGVGRLHLEATLNAIEFYRAQGFVLDKMGSFRLRSGLSVPCATMYKNL
jgi:putative acetyltransferase